MTSALPDSARAPACVGVLLWRRSPGRRELAALELDGRTVLLKGVLRPGEPERGAAARVAETFTGARTAEAEPLGGSHPPTSAGRARIGWWRLRWTGLDGHAPHLDGARVMWLPFDEAVVRLDDRHERELVRGERTGRWTRLSEWWGQPRRARERRARREIDDMRTRILARPDGPTGTGAKSWQRLALDRVDRAAESLAEGDPLGASPMLAEARRFELFGMGEEELAVRVMELAGEAEAELEPARRDMALELLDPALPEPDRAFGGSALIDACRARRAVRERAQRDERVALGCVLAVALVALWQFAAPEWYMPEPAAPPLLYLGVLIFGVMGGAVSALAAPTSRSVAIAISRPIVGAVAALVGFAVVTSGVLNLGITAPPAWLALSFAAGFLERAVRPKSLT